MLFAQSTPSTLAYGQLLLLLNKVTQQLPTDIIKDQRARRNWNDEVRGGFAGAITGSPVGAIIGNILMFVSEALQRVQRGYDFKDHVPAPAAVSTVRAAARTIFLSVEMYHPRSAAPGSDVDFCFINEHRNHFRKKIRNQVLTVIQQFTPNS